MKIQIGKNTLETLTLGLYINPMDLYREYLQNSIDSIDEAYDNNLLRPDKNQINIIVDKNERVIQIFDNGIGLKAEDALSSLVNIGDSKKTIEKHRGFRGIGRLIGINCADRITFKTTYPGEKIGTKVVFDCKQLKEIMIPGQYLNYDINRALETSITHINYIEGEEDHYFKVTLEGVNALNNILEYDNVKDYLLQVAPIPYNSEIFSSAHEVKSALSEIGKPLYDYNIYINRTTAEEPLKKLYSDNFWVCLSKKTIDKVKEVKFEVIKSSKNELLALLWYATSNYYGSIYDHRIKGLRLRHGNLLIGDNRTANRWFKEDRFNGWYQGEIFIVNDSIIPNARRDDFEFNETYIELNRKLKDFGDFLSKEVRKASQNRNQIHDGLNGLDNLLNGSECEIKYQVLKLIKKEYTKAKLMEVTFDLIYESMGEKDGNTLINRILKIIT